VAVRAKADLLVRQDVLEGGPGARVVEQQLAGFSVEIRAGEGSVTLRVVARVA
jgi:hypothetical protein